MKFKNKIYLDYSDVLSMCHNLEDIASKLKPDLIVGIVRGGLLPALHLSHALERPMETVTWQTRDKKYQQFNERVDIQIRNDDVVLFVDDINDTGRTFKDLAKAYNTNTKPNVHFISLVEKTASDFHGTAALTLYDSRWIVFPWEKD